MASGWGLEILSSLLFPAYKLNLRNAQPKNMWDIVFENTKDLGGTVNRANVYAEAAVLRVLYKKMSWEISQNS